MCMNGINFFNKPQCKIWLRHAGIPGYKNSIKSSEESFNAFDKFFFGSPIISKRKVLSQKRTPLTMNSIDDFNRRFDLTI